MTKNKYDQPAIGSAWVHTAKRGKFLSGNIMIEGVKHTFYMTRNIYKANDRQPDFIIYKNMFDKDKDISDNESIPETNE